MSDDFIDDFLGGGGGKSAFVKADAPGTTYAGRIVDIAKPKQQTAPDGTKKWYDEAQTEPMMEMPITLNCPDKKVPGDDEDDGNRTLYVRYKMREAIRDACRAADAKLAKGGHLSVTYTGDDAPKRRGENGAKLFTAIYTPANPADDFLGDGDQGQRAAVPVQQNGQAAAQPAAPAAALPTDRPGPNESNADASTRLGVPLDVLVAISQLPQGFDNPSAAVMVNMARTTAGAPA